MKSFLEFIKEERVVGFDVSSEPRSTVGATDTDKLVKTATILTDGGVNERKFRICVLYVNPRRDDGRTMDVFPAYSQPACSTAADLRSVKPDVDDRHGRIEAAIAQHESSHLAKHLEK